MTVTHVCLSCIFFYLPDTLCDTSSFSEVYCRRVKGGEHLWRTPEWELHPKPVPPALGEQARPRIWTYSQWKEVGVKNFGFAMPPWKSPADIPTKGSLTQAAPWAAHLSQRDFPHRTQQELFCTALNRYFNWFWSYFSYDAELHLVHYKSTFDNISAAIASNESDALAVVGILIDEASTWDQQVASKSRQTVDKLRKSALELSRPWRGPVRTIELEVIPNQFISEITWV